MSRQLISLISKSPNGVTVGDTRFIPVPLREVSHALVCLQSAGYHNVGIAHHGLLSDVVSYSE